jgi:membrane fusion protein, multidrug efflux system
MNKTPVAPSSRPDTDRRLPDGKAPRRRRATPVIIVVVALLLGLVWWVNHRQAAAAGPMGGGPGGRRGGGRGGFGGPNAPLPVGVEAAKKGDIHLFLNALGTVTPSHIATVRSQVSGQLQQIAFQEGQLVHQGDLLAVIDPRPFQNTLAQAQAQLRQAQAQLRIAQGDLERYETLAKEDSIAKQQVDTTRAQVSQYEGSVQVAEAAIATANLNINYCNIRAPFDGRVGLRLVDTGNYITPGDASGIVVITQTKPITAIFTLPEDEMGPVTTRLRAGARLPVDAYDRSQTKKIATGVLVTADNQIDPTTGTFKLRAEFANEDETLFPNQFVNIRVLLDTVHDATVIPTSAVERGQKGEFVYVVSPEQTAVPHDVTLGPAEGELVSITAGLNVGDQVVTDGADKLKDGQKVILNGGADQAPGEGRRSGGPPDSNGRKRGPRAGKKAGPDGAGSPDSTKP